MTVCACSGFWLQFERKWPTIVQRKHKPFAICRCRVAVGYMVLIYMPSDTYRQGRGWCWVAWFMVLKLRLVWLCRRWWRQCCRVIIWTEWIEWPWMVHGSRLWIDCGRQGSITIVIVSRLWIWRICAEAWRSRCISNWWVCWLLKPYMCSIRSNNDRVSRLNRLDSVIEW